MSKTNPHQLTKKTAKIDFFMLVPDVTDTPGIVLIRVVASNVRYWDGDDEGEITV